MNEQNSFSSLFAPESGAMTPEDDQSCWKVMLVDDEPDIHAVLRLALQDLIVEGRNLRLIDARSAEEAKTQLIENPDIALILLDVVMENDHAGLELVRYIRTELCNRIIQIVLVTGQPGYAPQRQVVTDYEINNYRLKSELTADKIFVSVYAALRTYHIMSNSDWQLRQLETQAEILRAQQMELLQHEEELRESEMRHRSILQTAMDGFWLVDIEGRLLEVSDTYSRMSGYSEQELLTMKVSDLDADECADQSRFRIRNIMSRGEARFESRHRRKDGSIFDVEVSVQYRPVDGGQIVTFVRDITERTQLDKVQLFLAQACRGPLEDRSFFNELAEYLARNLDMDYICIDRLEGDLKTARTLAVWNEGHFEPNATYTLKDTPCGEVVGKEICSFPKDVCRLFPHDQALQELRAESYVGVALIDRKHRVIGLIAMIGHKPLRNTALHEAVLKLVAVRASSELAMLEAEEERSKLEVQLQQAQKMESVGRLAGGVAHDFNNMLGVILGHAELGLLHLDPAHPVCRDLVEIRKAGERSANLTRQLLAFARKQAIEPKVLDLNETVTCMLKMLQRLLGEDIHLSWLPEPGLWQVLIDPSQVDQILANLCVNARDAIEGTGLITLETENITIDMDFCAAHLDAIPGDYVRLIISDNGRGMDRDTATHIFEPFFTTKELGKGTGLGLSTVYGAVKQNNGFISIYSEPGHGTTFSIYLPRHTGDNSRVDTATEEVPLPAGHETVLLVEDEAAILDLTATMLEKLGYTVLPVATPGEAISIARERDRDIQLLLTDVIMPEMNGRDLADKLLNENPNLKCLFMSGYTADVIAHHGVLEDGVHFMQKPFSLATVASAMRRVLDEHPAAHAQ